MAISNKTIAEQLMSLEQETQAEEIALWGRVQGDFIKNDLTNSPAFKEIIIILHEVPLLVAPALRWVKRKRAEMAAAQLDVLYSPAELAEMRKLLEE